jgi:hypothetical protein
MNMLVYIQDYLPMAESVFVILGVIFIVVQIRRRTIISRADHDRQKKQSTIEFYNSLSSDSYQFLDDIRVRTMTWALVNSDKELRKNVINYLSRLERLAIGVATDVYDFDVLCLMSGHYLYRRYMQFQVYIVEARIRKNAPMQYKNLELLVDRIEKHRENYPNQIAGKKMKVTSR